ncbi:type VI secretion system protein [Dyella subtropica]|uniref:type VI secretion system protein n=1 Tax=Dyella subtropica TaxID=2992127 RepID=UPI0022511328|nr:type VI secretion system protein [Dyella subtropica]
MITLALTLLLLAVVALVPAWRQRSVKLLVSAAKKIPRLTTAQWLPLWTRLRGKIDDTWRLVDRACRYLLARRDWRYQSSWLLLMGFPGDGKSSLAASIPEPLRRESLRSNAKQEAWLRHALPDAQCGFLRRGILLDPQGGIGEPGVASDARWPNLLADIDSLRPDRALDGIVWVVSAARLLAADEVQWKAMGKHAFVRINELQEAYAFALPVYVVISHCDAVQGFDAFWLAQPQACHGEIVGWSSPSVDDNGTPAEWVDKAFDRLTDGFRALVLEAATRRDAIDDADNFFLFPRYMRELLPPLRTFLGELFRLDAYETRAFCRGIYFTGVMGLSAGRAAAATPRGDVAFVEDLIAQKAFAEQRLAQRTQKGLLLRNQLIRHLQLGMIGAAILLAIALPWTAARVNAQAEALHNTMVDVSVSSKRLSQRGCLDQEHVYQLLEEVATLDTRTRYLMIPLSWVDPRVKHGIRDVVAKQALEQVILPSMACSLEKRIDALSSVSLQAGTAEDAPATANQKLLNQVRQVLADLNELENQLDRFAYVSRTGSELDHQRMLQDFSALADYIYGKPLPSHLLNSDNILADALVTASYPDPPHMTQARRAQISREMNTLAQQAQRLLLQRVQAGTSLLSVLQENKPPLLPPMRRFNAWMDWVREAWLTSTPAFNPCSRIVADLQPNLDLLIDKHHYDPGLRASLDRFDTQNCYLPAVDILRGATLAPYGALFVVNPDTHRLEGINPGLFAEARGLTALVDLDYMQLPSPQPYRCNGAASGWRSDTFGELSTQMRQYLVFAAERNISPVGTQQDSQPLFDRLARGQLKLALADSLARNQRTHLDVGVDTGLDATSPLEQMLATESANFAQAIGPYLESLRRMRQLGMNDLAGEMDQCARNYAADMLLDISGLATSSHLYDPPALTAHDDGAVVFDLGSTPVLQSYLNRQLARAQVLAGYAAPFATLLKNSGGLNDSHRVNTQADTYWANTIAELNRQVQFADPAGQVAQLNDFFLKQLGALSYGNCPSALNTYAPAQPGNDLFSERRVAMLRTAQVACIGNSESDASLHFVRISALFNSQLAGRYPFGAPDAPEVSPAVVKAFFVYYANEKPTLETWLVTARSREAARIKGFIDQLDAVQTFFAGNLLATPQSVPISLDVGFRALAADSPYSNQMIHWSLRAGGNSANWPGSATSLIWNVGDPMALDLQWADLSRYTPLPDAKQTDLSVSGYHAVFQASGAWALLRLRDLHISGAGGSNALDPAQQLLQFQLPVSQPAGAGSPVSTGKAQFYLNLKLSARDPASKAMAPLVVPDFPQVAPREQ